MDLDITKDHVRKVLAVMPKRFTVTQLKEKLVSTAIDESEDVNRSLVKALREEFNLTLEDLYKDNREEKFAYVRQSVHFLLREEGMSLVAIGRLTNRNHATVLHSISKVTDAIYSGYNDTLKTYFYRLKSRYDAYRV